MTEVSRDLTASTLRSRAFDDDDESDVDDNEVLDDSGFFNFEKWSGTNPVYYEPNFGDDNFIHEGQSFEFSKDEKENKYNQRWEKFVVIRCMGRSTQPIKDLIEHVKDWYGTKENHTTKIYRSEPKQHGYGGGYWECQATRPSRPISTVSLDEEQKTKIVADINDYLMPRTSRWYAARGIPYLRGK
jgi:chaperone BCS1